MRVERLTVLIIDDDSGDTHLIRRYLQEIQRFEVEVLTCDSLSGALSLLARHSVDLVLLDYRMGSEDTLGVIQSLTGAGERLCRAVIMVTGQGDEETAAEAIKSGALDYISKARLGPEVLYHSILSVMAKADLSRQLEIQRQELLTLARYDELTGLLNRRAALERFDQEFQRSKRHRSPLCFLMIDLDHFKAVNDGHGHLVGDRVLAAAARKLGELTRSTDAAGRLGGEEFCVSMVEATAAGAVAFGERVRTSLEKLVHAAADRKPLYVSCSVGVAEFEASLSSPLQLVSRADQALYQAKAAGRNCVRLWGRDGAP